MSPAPGERCCRFVGDRLEFRLADLEGRPPPEGWRAFLRTNLGRAAELRREILEAHTRALNPAGGSWRDVPMARDADGWRLNLPVAEVGYFKAKAYAVDPRGWQRWPEGADFGISVHPDQYRTGNTLYCAFTRLFGDAAPVDIKADKDSKFFTGLDQAGYTAIPPSGKLRDLTRQLPHIIQRLGCRILQLLPVNPTPTTYARFGRYGSPYAALDLTAIDPALVVFDRKTTGVDQFRELTYAAHLQGAVVFLDIVINHTGWGSVLQETHPEWFLRNTDQTFASPGAWGVTWEDLVELKHENVALWDELSEIFLTWCRRGVDGFRCDAGYKVPVAAWQYIVARVQQEFPDTIFLLEGLGGAWEATEALLTEGGMQWAYSELFQNYTPLAISGYLDHFIRQSPRVGLLLHYSETHDNERLAARGGTWSLLRNRLCGLASVGGGFGFTCGVEWLATEKIRVHDRTPLNWDSPENLVAEIAALNRLLSNHPCFFDGARLTRVSPPESAVFCLLRESEDGSDRVLILVNTSPERSESIELRGESAVSRPSATLPAQASRSEKVTGGVLKLARGCPGLEHWVDLLDQKPPASEDLGNGKVLFRLQPGGTFCLSPSAEVAGGGERYRSERARAGWAIQAISAMHPAETIPFFDWRKLARCVDEDPARFLGVLSGIGPGKLSAAFVDELGAGSPSAFPQVINWSLLDARRITLVPPGHWLLIQDTAPFRVALECGSTRLARRAGSVSTSIGHIAAFAPQESYGDALLQLERYDPGRPQCEATIRFLPPTPPNSTFEDRFTAENLDPAAVVLLTNERGGMARLCVDLGRITSKYDCALAANLHPSLPVDRHVFAKRIRVWVNADGFLSSLDARNLRWFKAGPPALWHFVANAGDGRTVEIQITAQMLPGLNTTVFSFARPSAKQARGKQLPETSDVRLTVRVDIEDRNFHWETKRNGGADFHFSSHTVSLPARIGANLRPETDPHELQGEQFSGFAFNPASDRQLRVFSTAGLYHPAPEWSENIPHPVEQSRGQTGSGDAFSPGWFELPLGKGTTHDLILTADASDPARETLAFARTCFSSQSDPGALKDGRAEPGSDVDSIQFGEQLMKAVRAYVVTRGSGKTVIAGYPWFLDWGRDTFICARGLLAAGMKAEVQQILLTFARFERDGTLPNTIFGEDASNRDTSDAPLWFGLVCEELGADLDSLSPAPGRTLRDVLESIASNYIRGTPNGIRMDPDSGLIWSPSHFTWMDTNYPACTPREGYPVEIQALWIRLLRQLASCSKGAQREKWKRLASQACASLEGRFWHEDKGYYADVLIAGRGQPASAAVADDALRSNCLLVVSLGLCAGERARRCVLAALQHLVVPGALRSLAPLPVSVPLPNIGNDGRLLNDPRFPYWARYEGDEDTRRKPAYHNGTAWTWGLPNFCEAMARGWDFSPEAVAAARAYLGSVRQVMSKGCLGQIPEILDGDAPHLPRGCDAQAWGVTEALRVWKLLQ
ncbi:MAG TPA: amylo-alpha-1,6-glucosidase [Verrucomicrobiae bacterium]|nr:amylo-alpha-1,6-glucosidase [Verrucomicrobiae bacterium]